MAGLQDYLTALRLTPTSERRIEGQHAKLQHRGRASPKHTEYYQSFGLRSAEVEAPTQSQDKGLDVFVCSLSLVFVDL